jgi:endoglucanase
MYRWQMAAVIAAAAAGTFFLPGQGMRRIAEAVDHVRDLRFASGLSPGINLGNSLDSYGLSRYKEDAAPKEFEVYWHNPVIRQEWFWGVKEAGFHSVRIPVSWGEHADFNFQIDEAWMMRVQEVTDMALDAGLYVILDMHHEKWLVTDVEKEEEITERLCSIWSQISAVFADYDERLVFEGMNEPRLIGSDLEWTKGTPEMREMVNRLNEAFVNTIRESGGYNRERYLLIPGYSGSSQAEALLDIEVPAGENLMVSVHDYSPHSFTSGEGGEELFDPSDPYFWESMDSMTKILREHFILRGIPVILTEFGCEEKKNPEERLEWAHCYVDALREAGIPYIWWDNGAGYRLFDRVTGEQAEPELIEILTE